MDKQQKPLTPIMLGVITRLLRTVRNLHGKVYLVGGVVTEGYTFRDLDVVLTNLKDIPIIKKALGKYAKHAHFLLQRREPPATLFVKITGREAGSPDLKRGKPTNLFEYAS